MTASSDLVAGWECFSDVSYFDMWCVRRVGEKCFGHSFHVVNEKSAKELIRALSEQDTTILALEADKAALVEAASAFLEGADRGMVSVEVDRNLRDTLAKHGGDK